jgi:hypothetical protein
VEASVAALPARPVAAHRHRALLARGGLPDAGQLAKARQALADLGPA